MSAADVVFDTSAVFALLRDEPGADQVEAQLIRADAEESIVALSFASLTEIFYNTLQLADRKRADELIAMVKSWSIKVIFPTKHSLSPRAS